MTLKDTHPHTTLTAMCQRVNFIFASIFQFSMKKYCGVIETYFSLDFHFLNNTLAISLWNLGLITVWLRKCVKFATFD